MGILFFGRSEDPMQRPPSAVEESERGGLGILFVSPDQVKTLPYKNTLEKAHLSHGRDAFAEGDIIQIYTM